MQEAQKLDTPQNTPKTPRSSPIAIKFQAHNMTSLTLPPILPRIKPHQPLRAHSIPLSQQTSHIHIQRTIRFRIRQQLVDGRQRPRDGVSGRPGSFEEVETDLAGLSEV